MMYTTEKQDDWKSYGGAAKKSKSLKKSSKRTSKKSLKKTPKRTPKRSPTKIESRISRRISRLKKMFSLKKGGVNADKIAMKKYSKKSCPRGSISRKSFTRKSGIKVESTCVKSKGVRSKGLKPKVILPKLKEGSLLKYGYMLDESDSLRHKALKRAVKKYGFSKTIKKLNAVRVLSKNIAPENSKIYEKDIRYVEKYLATLP